MTPGPHIAELLRRQALAQPRATAILAPGRGSLSHGELFRHVEASASRLRAFGVGRNDRVATVLPNGPEMATAFLAVASTATSAPLNPAYRAAEFEFYLADLKAKALIVHADLDSPSREVARALQVPVIELRPDPEGSAGLFRLDGHEEDASVGVEGGPFAQPDDIALVLHTSGTTSRPKIVPLTQANVCASAVNIQASLALTPEDRCLNVMPLFHIHGLMAAVLSSMSAGASVVCTPGFRAEEFLAWLGEFRPSWYTAVPTMHQAVLAAVGDRPVDDCPLRFARSSSASLPPIVMQRLEGTLGAPVIEAYGMTEAAHQMASNPLPPAVRKPGTVGRAAGPEVAIMDGTGHVLPAGARGEIVIRGENVTPGYENNPGANDAAFTGGWFRTGDEGVIDPDGYLSITGRLKEMVNRGGEKIAPREVDEALLEHPDVEQAVAFAVPHETLGEDLAAAVVVSDPRRVTERQLREFAFERLADFKVPSRVVFVDRIPKGPTGKVQRIGLATQLATALQTEFVAPRDALESALAAIWGEALGLERVGIRDNFFALGGDSLVATVVASRVQSLVAEEVQPAVLFHAPTIEQLGGRFRDGLESDASWLVPIQTGGSNPPLFCVPGHGGDVFTFLEMARRLGPDQPVYGFRFPAAAAENDRVANAMVNELASRFVREMRAAHPEGPYRLCGFCFGGEVAAEMATVLREQDQAVDFVGLIYVFLTGSVRRSWYGWRQEVKRRFSRLAQRSPRETVARLAQLVRSRTSRQPPGAVSDAVSASLPEIAEVPVPRPYPGRVDLFRPLGEGSPEYDYDAHMGWEGVAAEIAVHDVPGDRRSLFQEPQARVLAESLRRSLEQAVAGHQCDENHRTSSAPAAQ